MLNKLQEIAYQAGQAIMEIYNSEDFSVEIKGDGSPLTRADKAAHLVIAEGLKKHFPEIPVLSEEGKNIPYDTRKNWKSFFLVDPLDGTKEFIKRNGEFTVNIALIEKGNPIAGVVYAPVLGLLYGCSPGEGLEVRKLGGLVKETNRLGEDHKHQNQNPKTDTPTPQHPNTPYKIVASRSHNNELTEAFIEEKHRLHGDVELVPMGSSLKICLVAEGKADVYPRLGPTMEWDTAAAHAVALAARCSVLEYESNTPLKYNKESLLNPFFIVERGLDNGLKTGSKGFSSSSLQ